MVFQETEFKLKDGRNAVLRSPCENDAMAMLNFIIRASGETEEMRKKRSAVRLWIRDGSRVLSACLPTFFMAPALLPAF